MHFRTASRPGLARRAEPAERGSGDGSAKRGRSRSPRDPCGKLRLPRNGIELTSDKKILVVGAGLAGLASAYTLRKNGFDVTVLEAASHPGGRVVRRNVGGFQIELGANMFLETYAAAGQMAEELGVPLKRTPVPIHSGIYRNGRFHGLYGDNRPGNLWKTARTILSFRLLPPRGVWQAVRFARMLQARKDDLSFDDHSRMLDLDTGESVAEFFETKIGTESLEWLFGPGLTGYTFAHPEQIGAAYAMATLWHVGLNGVAWPCLPEGGIGAFVDALVRACGPSVKLSAPVRRIVLEDGAARGAVTDAGLIEADAVICATTATAALEIAPDLPPTVGDVLRRVTYSKCCRVFFGVDSSPFPQGWYAVAFPRQTGTLVAGMSNAAVLAPETVPKGKALIDALVIDKQAEILFALSDDRVRERVLSEVLGFFPEMSREPLFTRVHRWPEAMCLAPGGTMTALYRMRREGFGGVKGLFLAGDYMGVPSVNAALQSGLDAAAAAAECLRLG